MGNCPADGSREKPLREVLTVSPRGQITLPAGMRRHLGIAPRGAVMEVAHYSDAQIAEWDRADVLSTAERQVILQRLLQH
jgi:bifunctional DNA-binding transcriptional regulator/antitoxin component of YhaV-PrlF toxin-antitoxin module